MDGEIPQEIAELDFTIPVPAEFSELDTAYEAVDTARTAFLKACSDHCAFPSLPEIRTTMAECGNQFIFAFRKSIETIQNTFDPPTAIETIVGLMVKQDFEYITCFKELVGDEGLDYVHKEWLHDQVEQIAIEADDDSQLVEQITTKFGVALEGDSSTFIARILERENERRIHTRVITIGAAILSRPDSESEDTESYFYHPFMIEPPLQPHRTDFIGTEVEFDYSDHSATYGKFWIPDSFGADMPPEERESAIQEHIAGAFDINLNALGNQELQFTWIQDGSEESLGPDPEIEG
jgi:hypothetical protein